MISRRFRGFAVLGALGLMLGACGDGDPSVNPDAQRPPDAGEPDAEELDPNDLRSGTIAVTDVTITNPAMPFRGASVSITYRDLTEPSVDPAFGDPTPQVGACSVWIYEVGEQEEPAIVDEGPVTIVNTLSAIGTCAFDETARRYRCPAGQGTVPANSTATPLANGTVSIAFSNEASFPDGDVVGTYAELTGFENSVYNGRFPVVGQVVELNTLVVANPAAVGEMSEVVTGTPTYSLYAGEGPTPANVPFLGGTDPEEETVTVSKSAGGIVAAFNGVIVPSGDGLRLATGSAQPHELPSVPEEVTFSCAEADGGDCGIANGSINGFVLSGSTTDADVTGTAPTSMPDAVTRYATFQCRGQPFDDKLVVPEEVMEAILSTNPTRIQTQLLRITADLAHPQTSLVVGHGLVGFTDVTAEE